MSALNQNQPMTDMTTVGMITPHTVIDPMRPVMRAPPKLAKVVMQSRMMVHMQIAIGLKVALNRTVPYPTAVTAMATLPITSDRP